MASNQVWRTAGLSFRSLLPYIYINDLSYIFNSSEIYLFADDTNVTSFACLRNEIEEDLSTISQWLNANKLALNFDKTVQLTFGIRLRLIILLLKIIHRVSILVFLLIQSSAFRPILQNLSKS